MKRRYFIALLILALAVLPAFAQDTIKAEVDALKLSLDQQLTYKIIITSSQEDIPQPQLPKFEDFSILSEAQSSTISFVKGTVKSILVYAFILAPRKSGKLKIEPASIKIKNKIYSSNSLEIEVAPAGRDSAKSESQEKRPSPQESTVPPKPDTPSITL